MLDGDVGRPVCSGKSGHSDRGQGMNLWEIYSRDPQCIVCIRNDNGVHIARGVDMALNSTHKTWPRLVITLIKAIMPSIVRWKGRSHTSVTAVALGRQRKSLKNDNKKCSRMNPTSGARSVS